MPLRSVIAVGPVSVKRPTVGAAASTAPTLFTVTSSGNSQSAVSTPWKAGVAASAEPAQTASSATATAIARKSFTTAPIYEMTLDR